MYSQTRDCDNTWPCIASSEEHLPWLCFPYIILKRQHPAAADNSSSFVMISTPCMCAVCMQLDAKGQPLEQPLELSFQDQYGDIERHLWFGDGYVLLGFNTGHLEG